MTDRRLRVDDFDYSLPEGAIAQTPAEPRDASRLLVLHRATGEMEEARFRDLGRWLDPGDLLVVNDSRVLQARLSGTRRSGGAVEILALRPHGDDPSAWEALVRPSRRLMVGEEVSLRTGEVVAVGERLGDGTRVVRFGRDPFEVMGDAGELPLPPYITDRSAPPERYQTVYSRPAGSAAAPTAGLHFTERLLRELEAEGVRQAEVTLHVGLDTFRPLEGEYVDEHRIHREWYRVPGATGVAVDAARRVVAVGTTAVRVLETAARTGGAEGWTELYVTPPYRFATVGALVTNFHLPRSSLLLLVTAFVQAGMPAGTDAFAARDRLLNAYRVALKSGYRFFSFGDAMLIV